MPLHLLRAAKKDSTTAATSLFCCCHCLHHPFLRPAGIVILLSSVGLGTITQTFSETMAGPNDAASPSTSSSSGSGSSFPAKEVLLTAGTGFFLGMFYFYKRKQTLPFKVRMNTKCYNLTITALVYPFPTVELQGSCQRNALVVQVCYGLMWPTLGGGIMLAVTPTPEEMAQVGNSTSSNAPGPSSIRHLAAGTWAVARVSCNLFSCAGAVLYLQQLTKTQYSMHVTMVHRTTCCCHYSASVAKEARLLHSCSASAVSIAAWLTIVLFLLL
jgi:hypothetical protein